MYPDQPLLYFILYVTCKDIIFIVSTLNTWVDPESFARLRGGPTLACFFFSLMRGGRVKIRAW